MKGGLGLAFLTTGALVVTLALLARQAGASPQIYAVAALQGTGTPGVTGGPSAKVSACSSGGSGPCLSAPLPTAQGVPYSHSWYINSPTILARLGRSDAQWLNTQSARVHCAGDFLTVLDFGHPTTKGSSTNSALDQYAMTLWGHLTTYRQIEQLAERYLDAWHATATSCPRVRLALGTSNYAECFHAVGSCSIYTAGQQWDVVVHDVQQYVSAKGLSGQITGVWVADDLEGSWDPWPQTVQFLAGVRDQEHTYPTHVNLVDYGDANAGACTELGGSCTQPWSQENVYAAAWGMGWNVPVPETYSSGTTRKWGHLAQTHRTLRFAGIMTECAGADPLPTGLCDVGGSAQWSPTMGYTHLQAVDPAHPIPYATNIQMP
jgi:hypothetical protein